MRRFSGESWTVLADTLTAAFACAAYLLNYTGAMPAYEWRDRAPSQAECDQAIARHPDRAWLQLQYGPRPICFALAYHLTEQSGRYPAGYTAIVMPGAAPFNIQVTEALRVLEAHRGGGLSTAQIYALRDRAGDCPAG